MHYRHTTDPSPWRRFQDEELQRIISMSTDQLFGYIRHVVTSYNIIQSMMVYHMMALAYSFHGLPGPDIAAEYKNTMLSLLMKLKGRLAEELQIFDDIQNVREVMTGEISVSDHTALFCVHKKMVQMSESLPERVNEPRIRKYLSHLSRFISKLESGFEENDNRYLNELLPQRELMERAEARRKRKRRAPERLNITSTKSRSYL